MTKDLDGKFALVTGSARGIGHAIATTLAARGAHILAHQRVAGDSPLVAGDSPLVAEIVAAGGAASVVTGELQSIAGVDEVVATTIAALAGRKLDILVHNAGVAELTTLDTTTAESFDRQFAINVRAPLFLTQGLSPHLADGGRVLVLSSVVGRTDFPGILAYAMTKGAMNVFVRNLASELAPRNITVNGVAPGIIDTDMSAWARSPEGKAQTLGLQALKRIGQPNDIADVVAFIASDDSRWVTGQVIEVSGGSKL